MFLPVVEDMVVKVVVVVGLFVVVVVGGDGGGGSVAVVVAIVVVVTLLASLILPSLMFSTGILLGNVLETLFFFKTSSEVLAISSWLMLLTLSVLLGFPPLLLSVSTSPHHRLSTGFTFLTWKEAGGQ